MNFRFKPPISGITAAVGSLFGMNTPDKGADSDNKAIDVSKDGTTLYKEDIIHNILEELEKRKGQRSALERQWTLNANFLVGNQFCEVNPYRGDIEQLEPVYDWLEREAFNNIAPLIQTRIANLKKINYMMKVTPATNELDDYAKAEISTSVLQYTQKASDFESKKNTMIYWNELCGNCFWLSWWDKDKGEKYGIETVIESDNDGNERKFERAYYQGDLDYGLITPYEVFPESIFKQGVENQRSIILEQVKSVEDIYDLYGIEVEGSDIETFELTPVASGGGFGYENTVVGIGHRTAENAEKVITYFERPSKYRPNGLMVIIVGDEHLVYYGDMPYSKIPLIQTVCHEVPGQFFGDSVIKDLIPHQRTYNGVLNSIHEYIKRLSLGNLLTEEGSIDIEEYEENGLAPGAFLVYKKGTNPPVPVQNGQLPTEIMQERYNIKTDMEYIAGVSQLMVSGNAPQTNMSGTAINNLMEIDNTRLSLTGDHIRNSVRKLAIQWLEIYKRYATTHRIVNYVGTNNIGKALVWSAEDINSYDVEYVTENELLMSEEMQKQRFFDAYNMGLFTDDEGRIPERVKLKALEFMKIGNYSEIMNLNTLQIQSAQRENVFFENGAVPKVSEFDEHQIHIEEHLRYMLQMDFQILKWKKPEYAAAFENHLKEHKAIADMEEQQEMMKQLQGMNPPM
ncbi:MAG: hypothetical protein IJ423_05640 [Clostridia bacterium]|nr:hypothetical protein [Clostridia bacterium]MBQ8637453.1 hypothetical protein [Clostridia bacterium]